MNFSCTALAPDAMPCGNGKGTCVAQDTCWCPEGWTGAADFMPGTARDCDSFVPAITGLWAAAICTNVVSLVVNARSLGIRVRKEVAQFREEYKPSSQVQVHVVAAAAAAPVNNNNNTNNNDIRTSSPRAGLAKAPSMRQPNSASPRATSLTERLRKRGLHMRDAFIAQLCGVILANVSFIALGAVRIAEPEVTIGTGVAATVFLALGTIFFWVTVNALLGVFVILSAKQARAGLSAARLHTTTRGVRILIPFGISCAFIAGCLPLGMLNTVEGKPLLASLHYGAVAFLVFAIVLIGYTTLLTPLIRDLRSSLEATRNQQNIDSGAISAVLKRLQVARSEAIRSGLFQTVLCLSFAAWPWLTRKSSYMQALSWIHGGFSMAVIGATLLAPAASGGATTSPKMSSTKSSSKNRMDHHGGGGHGGGGAGAGVGTATATSTSPTSLHYAGGGSTTVRSQMVSRMPSDVVVVDDAGGSQAPQSQAQVDEHLASSSP